MAPAGGPGGEGEGEYPSRWAGLGDGLWCGLSGEGGAQQAGLWAPRGG